MNEALTLVSRVLVGDLERRFPYAAALISGATGIQITDTGNEQSATEVSPKRGIVFTVYDGSRFVEYATATLAPDRVAREVKAWSNTLTLASPASPLLREWEGARGVRSASASPSPWEAPGDGATSFETPMELDPDAVSLVEKLRHVRDLQRRAHTLDPRIVQAQAQYTDHTRETTYIGRGQVLSQRVTRTRMLVLIAVSDGAQVRYHFLNHGGTGGFELAHVRDDALRDTLDVALRLLDAEKIEPGEYDIVTDNSISGVLAHESFGHGVELDLYPKGRALSAKYLDRPVAAPTLQMFDDPSVAGAHGSYFFDDEGELARPTQILRDGVFVQPISDLASALLAPGVHTPNGRRQDFTRKVYARMSNTFFAAGDTPPADIIAGVERGVYLRECESGMEDPMGWGIQITAHYGEEIVNGRLTGRLFAPVAITGYVPDVLQSIRAIGNDFQLDPGTCGKGHKEMVPVSSGGPHLRTRARLG
jgi:TldD protein